MLYAVQRNKEARQHNGRIVECYWDIKTGWNFLRVREDKSFPNGYTTAISECVVISVSIFFSFCYCDSYNHYYNDASSIWALSVLISYFVDDFNIVVNFTLLLVPVTKRMCF